MNTPDTISRDTWAREVLFYAECQLQGMLAKNQERQRRGEAEAYDEHSFYDLAEVTRHSVRQLQ